MTKFHEKKKLLFLKIINIKNNTCPKSNPNTGASITVALWRGGEVYNPFDFSWLLIETWMSNSPGRTKKQYSPSEFVCLWKFD